MQTTRIDESNFNRDQYKADLQAAYDCGRVSTLRNYIELNEYVRTGYGPETHPLIVYVDTIASVGEDREGHAVLTLVNGQVFTCSEGASEVKIKVNKLYI